MLIGNRSVLHKSPGRFLSGTVASIDRSAFSKPGMMRGAHFSLLAGVPDGHLAPSAWLLPRVGGAMSSVNFAGLSVSASGDGVLGLPGEGSASFSISFADAAGQLIVSGAGSASLTISTNTPLLTASIGGAGTASFTIGGTGLLGAEASGTGSASFTITATGSILPLDDSSPARTGSAAFTISGTLTPYAVGNMIGSTETGGALSEGSIASAVWSAAAASNANSGTMGELLNGAGGGSSPGAVADAVWAAAVRTLTAMSPALKEEIATTVWEHTQ